MTKLHSIHHYPLFRIAVCLIVGIIVSEALKLSVSVALVLFLLSLIIALVLFRHANGQSISIMITSMLLGCVLVSMQKETLSVPASVGTPIVYQSVLLSEPVERGKVIRCDMKIISGEWSGMKVKASILRDTVHYLYRRLHVNDGIFATSVMDLPVNYKSSNFNYVRYLESNGFVATTFIYWSDWRKASVSLLGLSVFERAKLLLMSFRQRLITKISTLGITDQEMAVVLAMTLGDKSMLKEMTRDTYAISGASHVLALSGLHLSIIYFLLSLMVARMKHHVWHEIFLLSAIWAYVIMVGMSPSVVRAATMITICIFLGIIHRTGVSLNTLSLTVIIMLLANPLSIYDVSFQLSFLSVLSILVLYPQLMRVFKEEWLMCHRYFRWFLSMLCVSFAAQVGTTPLVCYYFERIACYGLLTNFIVIPLTTIIIYMSIVMFVVSLINLTLLPTFIATLLTAVVSFLNQLLTIIATWPGASIEHVHINLPQLICIYVLVVVVLFQLMIVIRSICNYRDRFV